MIIIGLIGKKGSGKSTVADYFQYKYGFEEYALANPIKKIALHVGFTYEQLYGTQENKLEKINITLPDNICKKCNIISIKYGNSLYKILLEMKTNITMREFCQTLGEKGRELDINIWVDIMIEYLESIQKNIVISDIRYLSELEAINKFTCKKYIIKLDRLNLKYDEFSNHQSEINMDTLPYDVLCKNNGTIEELWKNIDYYVYYCIIF